MEVGQDVKSYNAATQQLELYGGLTLNGPLTLNTASASRRPAPAALVYGPTITIDSSLGDQFVVTVTDGVAFNFAAPTNPPTALQSQRLNITIVNGSGGALGAGTWDAAFKITGNVPAIANTKNRTFGFHWNGTNWVADFATAADQPN